MEQRNLYISDLHLFHKNVTEAGVDFDKRGFKDLDEMHDYILKSWNSGVNEADHVYILGDFVWRISDNNSAEAMHLLRRMKGNLHLITGNHDRTHNSQFKKRFESIDGYKKIHDIVNGKDRQVILSHYYMPFYDGHYHGNILLHGHSHVTAECDLERKMTKWLNENGYPAEIYNVGCMHPYINYIPRTLEYIIQEYPKYVK